MYTPSPRRLYVVAGLAAALMGCSTTTGPSTPSSPSAAKPAEAARAATPAAANATQASAQPAVGTQRVAAPAPREAGPRERFREQRGWSGTPAEEARRPGTYIVLNGKTVDAPKVKLGDTGTVSRIVNEGKNHNQVMDHLTHLTTRIGPRLTGSANVEAANTWAMEQFKSWGLEASLHEWGTVPVRFDRGPSTAKIGTVNDEGVFRSQRELEFTTAAWAAGTKGPVVGQIIKMPETEEQFEAVKDKLKGSWVLIKTAQRGRRGVGPMAGGAQARQQFFADMRAKAAGKKPEVAEEPIPQPANSIFGTWTGTLTGGPFAGEGMPFTMGVKLGAENAVSGTVSINERRARGFQDAKWDEAAKTLTFNLGGQGGLSSAYTIKLDGDSISGESKLPTEVGGAITVAAKRDVEDKAEESKGPSIDERVFLAGPAGYVSSAGAEIVRTGGSRNISMDNLPQDCEITVRGSDYDYINSRLADGATIHAEINCDNRFTAGPIKVYNTVAEIKGTEKPDEVVIVSAHLDSWNGPGSQGTTDNGTGSSVTLEAARILAAVKAKPKRTIRFILWTGEEQGLLGSRAYVEELKKNDLLKNVSACFVDDGGTNYEGGLNCYDSQVDILGAATAPVNGVFWSAVDQRFLDVNIKPTTDGRGRPPGGGGSDHQSFIAAGVPGFFWDEIGRAEYQYGWHTQNDKLELAIPEYLMQSSTCAAVTAYNLACAPTLLPRQPFKQDEKKDTTASVTTP
jgi:hypothetical protein